MCLCPCVPSPLDGLLCLVCMVSVPTTAPIFAVVVVAARLCTEVCVSLARVFKAGRYAHGLSPSPSTHPPPSALSRAPIPIIRSFMLFHTTSHCSSPSLALLSPFLPPLRLPPSLLLSLILSRRCSLPPTFIHKPRAWVRKDVILLENVDLVNYELICMCSLICG